VSSPTELPPRHDREAFLQAVQEELDEPQLERSRLARTVDDLRARRRWLILAVLVVIGLWAFYVASWRIHQNQVAADAAKRTIKQRYPWVEVNSEISYWRRRVFIRALGARNPVERVDIRNRLVKLKVEEELPVQFWLLLNADEPFDSPMTSRL
jgi:hypothetical protein